MNEKGETTNAAADATANTIPEESGARDTPVVPVDHTIRWPQEDYSPETQLSDKVVSPSERQKSDHSCHDITLYEIQKDTHDMFNYEPIDYVEAPLNLKRMMMELFQRLRNVEQEKNCELECLREELIKRKDHEEAFHEKPQILSGVSLSEAFSNVWEENRKLRFLLVSQRLRSPHSLDDASHPLDSVDTECSRILKQALIILNKAASFDTLYWKKRCYKVEEERQRLLASLMKHVDRLVFMENTISQDPILSGAFRLQLIRYRTGDIISQMHKAYNDLALAQTTNEQLEIELQKERSLHRELRQEWIQLQRQTLEMFNVIAKHSCPSISKRQVSKYSTETSKKESNVNSSLNHPWV